MAILKEEERAKIALHKAKELETIGIAFIEYDESNKILKESLENYLTGSDSWMVSLSFFTRLQLMPG